MKRNASRVVAIVIHVIDAARLLVRGIAAVLRAIALILAPLTVVVSAGRSAGGITDAVSIVAVCWPVAIVIDVVRTASLLPWWISAIHRAVTRVFAVIAVEISAHWLVLAARIE